MAYVGMTGQGTTAVLGTTGSIGCVRSIQLPEWVQEKVDASCLDTTGYMRFVPGDLTDPGEVQMTMVFDPTLDLPVPGTVETLTVTFPIGTDGNTTNAVLTGSGFTTNVGQPSVEINGLLELNVTFAFDGDTGPTFTKEAL